MGEFDFTYRLPQNFSRRVVQYLEQLESPNVARAFQNCTYDYEDLGLAWIKKRWTLQLRVLPATLLC